MHNIKKLTKEDLASIYPYMEQDFPDNERKPLRMIEESFDSGFMNGYGLYSEKDDSLLSYALFVCIGDVYLFDYLAVLEEYRDQGIGSIFLKMLRKELMHLECVIGEVENPDYCTDPAEKAVMERRLEFYRRNGVRDTGASGCVYGVEYRFVELSDVGEHTAEEAKERIGRFYHTYWPKDEDLVKFVQWH